MAEVTTYYRRVAKELAKLPKDTDSRDWIEAKKFLYELNLPLIWSQICLLAFGLTRNAIIQIWLLIEYINGWRRQPGKWDMLVALEVLDEIRQRINRLPDDHPREDRLLELWLYHSGWIYHPAGEFGKAAGCHERAVQMAETDGNNWGRLLSLFNAAYERLNEAILFNKGISEYYGEFQRSAYDFLDYLATLALDGVLSDNNIRWQANVHCHLIFYGWVVERRYPSRPDVSFLYDLPEALGPAFADAAVVLEALCELSADPERVMKITSGVALAAEVEWYTFAKLVQISALGKTGKLKEAEVVQREMDDFLKDRHGGHLASAILAHGLLK